MTDCYMILGADRVGKGTIIKNSLENTTGNVKIQHFTAPKDRNKPWEQYQEYLNQSFEGFKYAFCDRGFPETYFYESIRNNNELNFDDVIQLLRDFKNKFNKFNITIVKRDWAIIEKYHIEEIENGINHDESNESPELEVRRIEYVAYYRTMEKFYDGIKGVFEFQGICDWVENPPIDYTMVKE